MLDWTKLKDPYLIAEIGINHNGDMQIAKRLIDAAFATGWDCVKFQKRNPDVSVPDAEKTIPRATPWGTMSYLDYKRRVEFGTAEYDTITTYCAAKPISWAVSVWDEDSVAFIGQHDVPFLKIPSAHLTNRPLLAASAKTGLPLLVSTGMSTLEEVDGAVDYLVDSCGYGEKNLALMHCHSAYPAPLHELNLSLIPVLARRYGLVVGYSGHEFGLDPTTIAVALGATIIERHVTLDHTMWGTDQKASVEPQGMDKLAKQVRSVRAQLGDGKKHVWDSELPARKKLRGT